MTKLVLMRGVPGSGKTTLAKRMVIASQQEERHMVRVNRDTYREMLFAGEGKLTHVQETLVTKAEHAAAKAALKAGFDVVVDDTNLVAKFVREWYKVAENVGAEVEVIDVNVTKEQAIEQDQWRGLHGNGRTVGIGVIEDYFRRFVRKDGSLVPAPEYTGNNFEPYVPNPDLDRAILVDIDGTLAHMNGRGPYDDSLVHTDTPDEIVREIVNEYYKHGGKVIVFSARDEKSRPQTAKWLRDHGIKYDELYMRFNGDKRNDAVVKNEMFHAYVADRFNVQFVLDDRDRVVDMWRAKGIKCLQVGYGDF